MMRSRRKLPLKIFGVCVVTVYRQVWKRKFPQGWLCLTSKACNRGLSWRFFSNGLHGAGGMSQSVKSLPHSLENSSSIPSIHVKAENSNIQLHFQHWGDKDRNIPGAHWQASPAYPGCARTSERPCLSKQGKHWGTTPKIGLCPPHACVHITVSSSAPKDGIGFEVSGADKEIFPKHHWDATLTFSTEKATPNQKILEDTALVEQESPLSGAESQEPGTWLCDFHQVT